MITVADLIGKSISLILVSEDDGTIVVTGTIRYNGKALMFERADSSFPLPEDSVERIRVVNEDVKTILNNAEFALTLSVGNLPDGTSTEDFVKIGIKWPKGGGAA